jgi:PKD repeat protein
MTLIQPKIKFLTPALLILLIIITPTLPLPKEKMAITNLTVETNQDTYCVREPITIQGTFLKDSEQVTEALIAMQILNRRNGTFAYRTITIGNPEETWAAEITAVSVTDTSNNPITKTEINTQIRLKITVKNNYLNPITVTIAYTVYDNTLIPIRSSSGGATLNAQASTSLIADIYIPEWATPGKAIISSNVYNDEPKDGGTPYTPERLDYFYILRNEQLEPFYSQAPTTYQTQPGEYEIFLRTSPDNYAQPGEYKAYIIGTIYPAIKTTSTTTYTVESDPTPPQASFTYYPTKIYQNMTVTFDASSSSAEGYNDTITKLEWTINDPYNPIHVIVEGNPPNPTITHAFGHAGTFTVTLNVTDHEGLWSTTSKPVIVYPEFGPTADFSWDPSQPYNGTTITFNATLSTLGWSAQTKQFSPIIQYMWNFSDGTQNTTSNAIITHIYAQPGNYTVKLTVMDAVGRTNTNSKVIEIINYTTPAFPWDVNGDGYVGIDDIFMVALHFGEEPENPNWDPRCDINSDLYIGVDDIFAVAIHFGEEAPP